MDEDLSAAARAARPYLARLAGPEAVELDARIADLIAKGAGGDDVDEDLSAALTATPALHAWTARLLGDVGRRPGEVQETLVRIGLPGDPEPVLPPRYRCPDATADYVWYQLSVGEEIPNCPTHNRRLVADPD